MKIRILFALLVALSFCAIAKADRPPNIVLILADDLGYGELGCYGQKWIKTPNIDRIAAEGIRFTQHYSGQAVCAPSRCALLTGYHMGHAEIRGNGNPKERGKPDPGLMYFPGQHPISDSAITIFERLKDKEYATGAMGKWGLGPPRSTGMPDQHGVDHFYGYNCQVHAHNHYPRFLWRNSEKEVQPGNDRTAKGETWSQDQFVKEALQFVDNNKEKPFFLYLPFAVPHLSIQAPEEAIKPYLDTIPEEEYKHRGYIEHPTPRAGYAAMITRMDEGIGQIMDRIKELGLDDNTLIIFTSDNGPTFERLGGADSDFFNSSGPLRGRKGRLLEGGIRVPMVARWPGKIKPGSESDHISAFWDYMPTLCDIAGVDKPEGIDGISFASTLLGEGEQKQHEFLYWEFSSYGSQQALRMGKWKALREDLRKNPDAPIQLYNLEEDIGESKDIASDHPEVLSIIQEIMTAQHTPSELFPFKALDK